MQPAYHAICVAGGEGSRFQGSCPKQFVKLLDSPLWYYSVNAFASVDRVEQTILVIDSSHPKFIEQQSYLSFSELTTVSPGVTRMHSVYQGLCSLASTAEEDDWVMVHDVARPCLEPAVIEGLIEAVAQHHVGGLLVQPLTDTVKCIEHDQVTKTLDRSSLYAAQTPQMFRYGLLKKAISNMLAQGHVCTDEAQAIEALGYYPKAVQGCRNNLKMTYPQDLVVLEYLLQEKSIDDQVKQDE